MIRLRIIWRVEEPAVPSGLQVTVILAWLSSVGAIVALTNDDLSTL